MYEREWCNPCWELEQISVQGKNSLKDDDELQSPVKTGHSEHKEQP